MNEAHAHADAERLAKERAARASLDEAHAKMSPSELQAALADCSSRIDEDGQAMRHASLVCAIEEEAKRSAETVAKMAKEAPAPVPALVVVQEEPASPEPEPERRLTRKELKAQEKSRLDEAHAAIQSEATAPKSAAPIDIERLRERIASRHGPREVIIHPTSVEPHPDLPPPLCIARERERNRQ